MVNRLTSVAAHFDQLVSKLLANFNFGDKVLNHLNKMIEETIEIVLTVCYSAMAFVCGYAIVKSITRKELLSTLISITLELALCCKLANQCRRASTLLFCNDQRRWYMGRRQETSSVLLPLF